MGAWGQGPFENDDALDPVDQVLDAPRGQWPALVRAALLAVVEGTPDGDGDEDEGAEAEVAAGLGPVEDLVVPAREALTRVLTASSVRDLWTGVGQWDAVLTELAPVRAALGVPDTREPGSWWALPPWRTGVLGPPGGGGPAAEAVDISGHRFGRTG